MYLIELIDRELHFNVPAPCSTVFPPITSLKKMFRRLVILERVLLCSTALQNKLNYIPAALGV